eukprot:TRINITY_DN4542_c0_g1_i1.p1 TRINITY_DN4542_c0_g1~~TRINITY_DN4542_c0_g1_i1.p1  ORF type:complete len:241 (+),score=51.41 TRINITY_DN4542_c0_g1_i1:53-724(+)
MGFQTEQQSASATVPAGVSCGSQETVPVAGVVVQTYDTSMPPQVPPAEDHKADYFPACFGTALFGCFGIAGTLICCPTSWGKMGSSSGFAWFNAWRAVAVFVILMLVVGGAIDCSKNMYPDEISQKECSDIKGNWNATEGACFGACPDGYSLAYAPNQPEVTLPHLKGTQWEQWCHDEDETCTGLSKGQLVANLLIAVGLFLIAAYFMRHYSKQIKEDTYESV